MEGIAVLMNNEWHSAVIRFGCVSYKILWVKFSRVKVCRVAVNGPIEGKLRKSRGSERLRQDYRVGNGYRLCVLGDLNGWV